MTYTYNDILPEIDEICKKNTDCFVKYTHDRPFLCPYKDLCFEDYEGPNNGNTAYETAMLARFMELKTGNPHKKFYFTFGSDPGFPYPNAYIIILAEDEPDAIKKFRGKFQDRNEGVINCSFWYTEEQWRETKNKTSFTEPAEVFA